MKRWIFAANLLGCSASEEPTATIKPIVEGKAVGGHESLVADDPGYVGVLLPSAAIDLAPTYEGKLDRVDVKVGQWIEQGATVATFDASAAREQLQMARAEVRVAQGEAGQAAAMSKHASRRLATERALFSQGITAADAVRDAQADRSRFGAAGTSAAGRIASAKARVEQLERQLEETELAAPFSGQIALVYRKAGALASPGSPVVKLISTERSFVRFAVPPADAVGLQRGATVDVVVDWLAQPMEATVRDVAPEIDPPTGMVFIEAELAPSAIPNARPHSPAWVRPRA